MLGLLWGIISFALQLIVTFMFCLTAGYVFALGKAESGINTDFFFFSLVCWLVLLVL